MVGIAIFLLIRIKLYERQHAILAIHTTHRQTDTLQRGEKETERGERYREGRKIQRGEKETVRGDRGGGERDR